MATTSSDRNNQAFSSNQWRKALGPDPPLYVYSQAQISDRQCPGTGAFGFQSGEPDHDRVAADSLSAGTFSAIVNLSPSVNRTRPIETWIRISCFKSFGFLYISNYTVPIIQFLMVGSGRRDALILSPLHSE